VPILALPFSDANVYSNSRKQGIDQFRIPDQSAIAAAANVSTGNPVNCPNGTSFFPQPVDHATWDGTYGGNITFLQQYELIDQFYKPGGPILLLPSDESSQILCLEVLSLPDYAAELGALVVTLEHRYFGISVPYGLNYTEKSSWDPDVLKSLTLDNVLADTVVFAKWLKQEYGKDSEVIVLSGDYTGAVATMLRAQHPDLFFGAWSSGTVTNGLVTDPKANNVFAWGDWVCS
jgi:hypothetical protein